MKHLKYLKYTFATCMHMQYPDLLLQHPDETLATYVWNRWNIWDIHLKTPLQHVQHPDLLLQHRYKTFTTYFWNIWNTWNRCLQHVVSAQISPCCLGEWIIVGVWSSIPNVMGCMRASSALATTNWVGERCPGYHELHTGELSWWRWLQSPSPRVGNAGGARAYVASGGTRCSCVCGRWRHSCGRR
jgi:hypothetical protein